MQILGTNDDLWDRVRGLGSEIGKGESESTSGGSDTPQKKRNDIPDLMRVMSVKVSVKDGKICNKMKMGKKLERSDVVETNGFGLEFVKTTFHPQVDCWKLKSLN